MCTQITTTVYRMIKDKALLLALSEREKAIKDKEILVLEESNLKSKLHSLIVHGDMLSTEDKNSLVNYILEYWIDYAELAEQTIKRLDSTYEFIHGIE